MITGVWDDHDFGKNDAGKTFPYISESKKLYLDFLDENESPRNAHNGLYQAYTFGDKGKSVKVILVDIRSFRDNKKDENGDSLGDEQWK